MLSIGSDRNNGGNPRVLNSGASSNRRVEPRWALFRLATTAMVLGAFRRAKGLVTFFDVIPDPGESGFFHGGRIGNIRTCVS